MDHAELTWEPLESSHVAAMAVNDEGNLLIQYKTGAIYEIQASPEEIEGLRNASSPGKYLNLMFRNRQTRVS